MNKKVITHLNFAKGFRGGEKQTLLLIKELSIMGFEQIVIIRKESQLAIRLKDISNLKIIQITKPYILNFPKNLITDILHVHETKAAQVAFFVNLLYKTPYIITRRVDKVINNNWFNKKIYENARYTVCLSSPISKGVLKISKKSNIKIIPDCVSDYIFTEEKILHIKNRYKNKFIIGHIGALDKGKGHDSLIKVARKLSIEYDDIHFIFLGEGKEEQNFKNQAKDLSNITFEGFVDNVGDYIKCFDLFVFPSLHEGLGSSLLDVMKEKVPIIASNVGGIPDIIKDDYNGILIAPKSVDELYNAIIKLYNNKELSKKLAMNGYNEIEKYKLKTIVEKYIRLYEGNK